MEKLKLIIKYAVLAVYIFFIIFIFSLSATNGKESSKQSSGVTDVVVGTVDKINPSEEKITDKFGYENVEKFVRKLIGHFGLFAAFGLVSYFVYLLFVSKKMIMLILLFCSGFLIALASESIQLLSDGRGPSMKDVFINYGGYFLTTIVCVTIYIIKELIKRKKQCKMN